VNAAADIIDTSHVEAAFANAQRADEAARRRRLIAISGIAILLGGIGLGALAYGASFLMVKARTEVIEVPTVYTKTELIEVPTVYETTKYVVTEKLVEVPAGSKVSERAPNPAESPGKAAPPPVKVAPPPAEAPPVNVAPKGGDAPSPDLTAHGTNWPPLVAFCQARGYREEICNDVAGKSHAPYDPCFSATSGSHCQVDPPGPVLGSAPDSAPVTRPWDTLTDKQYVGIITDVIDGAVCYDHDTLPGDCTHVGLTDGNHHAILDANGKPQVNPYIDLAPMSKWVGFDGYRAAVAEDPSHLSWYWVADGKGNLIKYEQAPKGQQASAPSTGGADTVALTTDGQSLNLDVGLGGKYTYSFMLDTGASDMTVRESVAQLLVRSGHAFEGESIPVVLADGSHHTVPTVVIDRVTVGSHTVENVVASVSPDRAMMLLGLSVLTRIGPFAVDAPHLTLTFNDGVGS
jgi:clan AA aspartic protease (TIGR02281 family)